MKTLPLCDLWDLKVKMQSLEKGILIVMDEIFGIKDIVSHPCEWLSATIKFVLFTEDVTWRLLICLLPQKTIWNINKIKEWLKNIWRQTPKMVMLNFSLDNWASLSLALLKYEENLCWCLCFTGLYLLLLGLYLVIGDLFSSLLLKKYYPFIETK